MPKKPEPKHFEPEWLERSLDRYYTAGLVFMFVLLVAFPLYRLREPSLRSDAKTQQASEYQRIGDSLFNQSCASCHGKAATGGSAPTLNSKQFFSATTDAQAALIITGGVPGSDMSAWSQDFGGPLTAEQIRQLVTYLRSLEAKAPDVPDWRKGTKAASSAGGETTVPADAGGGTPVAVTAGDTSEVVQFLKVDPLSVKAGKVTFTFTNTGNRQHEMIVLKTDEKADALKVGADDKVSEDASVGEISETDQGLTVVKTFDLAAGNYVLICNIAKHYSQGMRSAFTVTP
jgi:mono/diheme cytochrome c family protein/uncharacterized cupredoxin-like copper-binding protein